MLCVYAVCAVCAAGSPYVGMSEIGTECGVLCVCAVCAVCASGSPYVGMSEIGTGCGVLCVYAVCVVCVAGSSFFVRVCVRVDACDYAGSVKLSRACSVCVCVFSL